MDRRELETLKEHANENITRVFDALRMDYVETYKYINAPCPIHGGSKSSSFSWHLDYNVFQCFSRGCHTKNGKDIFGLVRGALDCSFPAAIKFVQDVFNGEDLGNSDEIMEMRENKRFVAEVNKKKTTFYPEEMLARLAYNSYLESRGYPRDLVEQYQAGVPSTKYKRMSNRIIFPIRDIEGRIVGFTGRTLLPNWKELRIGKWEHSKNFDKEHNLFNIDRAKDCIAESGIAILVEGPLDVLRLEQAGISNAVGIFGRTLYNGQMSLLIQAAANRLVLALDGDTAGKSGVDSAMKTAKSFFKIETVNLGDGDVGDLTVAQVKEVFKGKC